MKLGFSGEGFANILTLLTIIGGLLAFIIVMVAHRLGINITSRRFQFKIIVGIVFIFIVMPLWFSDLNVLWKLIATVVPLLAGLINYFAIDKMQRYLKERFIDNKR